MLGFRLVAGWHTEVCLPGLSGQPLHVVDQVELLSGLLGSPELVPLFPARSRWVLWVDLELSLPACLCDVEHMSVPLEGGWCACRSVSAGSWRHSLGSWWFWLAPHGCYSGLNLVSGISGGLQSAACWHAGEKRDWHRSVWSGSLCVVRQLSVMSMILNHWWSVVITVLVSEYLRRLAMWRLHHSNEEEGKETKKGKN